MTEKMIYICDPGSNYYGSIENLKTIALEVKKSGATYLKPQLYDSTLLYSDLNNPYYDLQCQCSMTLEQAEEILEYCESIKLKIMFSPFHLPQLKWINIMGLDTVKIASRLSGDSEFLSEVSNLALFPIITISEQYTPLQLNEYTDLFGKNGYQLLSGSSKYPSSILDYDLQKIHIYQGLSDHTNNINLAIAATAVGCQTIEKHVYCGWKDTPDISSSISTQQFQSMVKTCNEIKEII